MYDSDKTPKSLYWVIPPSMYSIRTHVKGKTIKGKTTG